MGRTPPAPKARRRRIEQSPGWQSPSTRVALNATGTNVEIHTTATKREPEDESKAPSVQGPLSEAPCRLGGHERTFGRCPIMVGSTSKSGHTCAPSGEVAGA